MKTRRLLTALLAVVASVGAGIAAEGAPAPIRPTPAIACGTGSLPEKLQGRAPTSDVATGRYAKGYSCNMTQIGHVKGMGGYRVERYVDVAGRECAYADSTLLFPTSLADQLPTGAGTYVYDMTNPARPVVTATLKTTAMSSPHETLRLNQKRGLHVAATSTVLTGPGVVDVYDVSRDCRQPKLLASSPLGILGHEAGFSPDGRTYYVASLYARTLAAVDLTYPDTPQLLWFSYDYQPHGVSISNDGKTLYMAEAAYNDDTDFSGLTVLDVSQIHRRMPNPVVSRISRLTWSNVSTPQASTPFTRGGRPYLLHTDEFESGVNIGAARIIDIQNVRKPSVVSTLRLAVNQPEKQAELAGDPGADQPFQGYQAHYCSLPSRIDPKIVACSFIMSGLRVFDISNLKAPREIGYFNKPVVPGSVPHQPMRAGAFAMSAPAYDEKTGDIWFTDGNSGFYVVRLTGAAKRERFSARTFLPGN